MSMSYAHADGAAHTHTKVHVTELFTTKSTSHGTSSGKKKKDQASAAWHQYAAHVNHDGPLQLHDAESSASTQYTQIQGHGKEKDTNISLEVQSTVQYTQLTHIRVGKVRGRDALALLPRLELRRKKHPRPVAWHGIARQHKGDVSQHRNLTRRLGQGRPLNEKSRQPTRGRRAGVAATTAQTDEKKKTGLGFYVRRTRCRHGEITVRNRHGEVIVSH